MATRNKKYCTFEKCPYDQPAIADNEKTTVFNHLGARAIYTFLAWIVLMKGVLGQSFFTGLLLLSMSLVFDYVKFSPTDGFRKKLCRVEYVISLLWCAVGLLGLFQVIVVSKLGETLMVTFADDFDGVKNIYFSIRWLWGLVGITMVGMTIVDWVANINQVEIQAEKSSVKSC